MSEIKTIGVLTSGGDAPGMNAAIRAVVRAGVYHSLRVLGIRKGFNGLINGDIFEMNARTVSDILHRGGTMLQTARCLEFKTEEGVLKGVNIAKVFGIEGLVVIGGDGSFRGAKDIALIGGMPAIGVPATIDNDIACSEYTIGFDTALNTVVEAVDKIRDTAVSHERCSVVEVMGRHAGYIALHVGLSTGAEVIIVPEKEFDFDRDVIKRVLEGRHRGKKHNIVIIAEGVGGAIEVAKRIESVTGIEARATVLGHLQRGGNPTVEDRINASNMGYRAVELLKNGVSNKIVVIQNNKLVDIDIEEGLSMSKSLDEQMIEVARVLAM